MTITTWRAIFLVWFIAALAAMSGWFLWRVSVNPRSMQLDDGFINAFADGAVPWSLIERIEIVRGANNRFEFARRNGRWFQTVPFEFPVESARLMEVIDQAAKLTARRDAIGGDDAANMLESTGLGTDAPSITFGWASGQSTIRLGRRLPAGFAWIDLGGERPQPRAARSTLHDTALLNDPRQWRQAMLFSRADVECDRLISQSVASDGTIQRLEIVREGSAWKVVSPIATRADRAAVERWLEALERAQASGFVVDSPSELIAFGLDTPSAFVEIQASTRTTDAQGRVTSAPLIERLELGSPVRAGAAERFARLSNYSQAIMEVDGTAVAAALPPPLLMIDPTAAGVRPEDVRSIRIEADGAESVRIERIAADWNVIDASGTRQAQAAKVDDLLSKLCQSRATEVTLSAAPANLSLGRVVLESFDGREIASIKVSRESNDGRFGLDDGSGVLRIFPGAIGIRLDAASYQVAEPSGNANPPATKPQP